MNAGGRNIIQKVIKTSKFLIDMMVMMIIVIQTNTFDETTRVVVLAIVTIEANLLVNTERTLQMIANAEMISS